MNSDSCGPQIAAVELFTAHFYILQIWFQTCKIIFSLKAKPEILSQGQHLQFLQDTNPRLTCVINVWFQPSLLVLLPAVTQQIMGQREGKLRALAKHACKGTAEWSGSVAQIQQRAEYQLRTETRCPRHCSVLKRRLSPPQTSSLQSCLGKTLWSLSAFLSFWHLCFTPLSCWSHPECCQSKECDDFFFFLSYVSSSPAW